MLGPAFTVDVMILPIHQRGVGGGMRGEGADGCQVRRELLQSSRLPRWRSPDRPQRGGEGMLGRPGRRTSRSENGQGVRSRNRPRSINVRVPLFFALLGRVVDAYVELPFNVLLAVFIPGPEWRGLFVTQVEFMPDFKQLDSRNKVWTILLVSVN